jgi:hypothetical protein
MPLSLVPLILTCVLAPFVIHNIVHVVEQDSVRWCEGVTRVTYQSGKDMGI